ncbi:hypothetical protein FQA39_LY15814 [Lamprigera yunnana]|nr:hypothetical protein FQA39_LY15814 [Lamprigera yunnana]
MDDYFKAIGKYGKHLVLNSYWDDFGAQFCSEKTHSNYYTRHRTYQIRSETLMTKMTVSFKPEEEVNKILQDGQIAKSVSTINGCTLLEVISDNEGGTTTVERIFSQDGVKAITKYKNIIATSYY